MMENITELTVRDTSLGGPRRLRIEDWSRYRANEDVVLRYPSRTGDEKDQAISIGIEDLPAVIAYLAAIVEAQKVR